MFDATSVMPSDWNAGKSCLVEMAQRGGRLAERQLDGAHVGPGPGTVRDVLAAERLEPRRQELDVLRPAKADGDRKPVRPGRHAHRRYRRPGPDRAGLGIGGLSGGAVTLVQADQREGKRGEDGGDAAGGVHGIRPQVRGELLP